MRKNRHMDPVKKYFSYVNNNRGSAIMTALVVGFVILAFCLSALMASYSLYSQTSQQTMQMQVKNMAQSFGDTLQTELGDGSSDLSRSLREEITAQLGADDTKAATIEMRLKAAADASEYTSYVTGRYDILVTFTASSVSSADAVITCRRSDTLDRDVQTYTVKRTYELK